jgi:hypothetical protein
MIPRMKIHKFFKKHLDKIKVLIDRNDFDTIYQMGFAEFSDITQDKVVQCINNELLATKWLTEEPTLSYIDNSPSYKIDSSSDVREIDLEVSKWMKKNKNKLIKLADKNEYAKFYDTVKKAFPEAQEDKLMMAVHRGAIDNNIHYELITD